MQTAHTVSALRDILRPLREACQRIAFIPTMGNLHEGHLKLVAAAGSLAEQRVMSIFVNPLQFNDKQDFDAYPNTLEEDIDKLSHIGVDVVFIPDAGEIYPNGMERSTKVEVPGLSDILCGRFRPGHFTGVATVVAKLFHIVQPDAAVFGEKDYQQLLVIRRMVKDLCMPIEIAGVATVREHDGLALSSRNRYLTTDERGRAVMLYRTLQAARDRIAAGDTDYRGIERFATAALNAAGFKTEYVAVRRAQDLDEPEDNHGQLVILAAAWLGRARLIDNILLDRS